jgi:hypothetical protein
MTAGSTIAKPYHSHWGNDQQRLSKSLENLVSAEDAADLKRLLDSVPISAPLMETIVRKVERSPVFVNLKRWLRFMERHYVDLLEADVLTPRLTDVEAIECISGIVSVYSYFPDRIFSIEEERHIMLCTRALVDADTDAKINLNTGHEADRYVALADYRWLDLILAHTDRTDDICRLALSGKVRRVPELELALEVSGIGTSLLDGAL